MEYGFVGFLRYEIVTKACHVCMDLRRIPRDTDLC
jgi:hypothetical protein